jgi:hypothetical protein
MSTLGCEITDFKTGQEDPSHSFQVQVYALLWSLDRDRNPAGRLATRLTVAYPGKDLAVATPTSADLAELRADVANRSEAARVAVSREPAEARPSLPQCTRCGVRQLCTAYWELPGNPNAQQDAPRRVDLQVTVAKQHGPSSWDAVIERAPGWPVNGGVLIRTTGDVTFRAGDRVRVLDAGLQAPESEGSGTGPLVVTLSAASEIYATT